MTVKDTSTKKEQLEELLAVWEQDASILREEKKRYPNNSSFNDGMYSILSDCIDDLTYIVRSD